MATKRRIEVFTAGCPTCNEAVVLLDRITCSSCEVTVMDMHKSDVARKARKYGVRSVPAVVVDGKLADCCSGRGVDEAALRAAGIGTPKR